MEREMRLLLDIFGRKALFAYVVGAAVLGAVYGAASGVIRAYLEPVDEEPSPAKR